MSGNTAFDSTWLQYPIKDLSGGINVDTSVVVPNELLIGQNIDLHTYGAAAKRGGYRKCNATARTVTAGNGGITNLFYFKKNAAGVLTNAVIGGHDGKIIKAVPDVADPLIFASFIEMITGLTATDRFSMAELTNRVFISSINHRLWTDCTNTLGATYVHNNGVAAPVAAPTVAVVDSGGALTIGVYKVGYSYLRSGDFPYETSLSPLTTATVTVNSSHLHVTLVASADPQIDKIRLYISNPAGTIVYRQETEFANAAATVDLGVTMPGIGVAGEINAGIPPKAKWVISAANRIWYIHTDEALIGSCSVRWSNVNDGSTVPAANHAEFGTKDGYDITGAGILQNYLVVFKSNGISMLDLYEFNIINTAVNEGAISHESIQSIYNGKALAYMAESGARVFDGTTSASISDKKVNTYCCTSVDIPKTPLKTCSMYVPTIKRYSLAFQLLNGSYMWMNYYFDANGWSNFVIKQPTAFCMAADKYGSPVPLFAYIDGTTAFICQMDYGTTDDSAIIEMKVKTVPHNFGSSATKQLRRASVEWQSSGPTEAFLEVIVDFGNGAGVVKKMSHEGSTFWGNFYWGHAYWGQTGKTVDRVDLRGKGVNYEFVWKNSSSVSVILYGLTFWYYDVALQGVEDAQ